MPLTDKQRIGQIQNLYNKYGDFYIAIADKSRPEDRQWSKHYLVSECWESEKGLWIMSKANNRTILPCELVLDIDDNPTIEKLNTICDDLESQHINYTAYFTGSKGYHIHIVIPDLIELSLNSVFQIKTYWISKYGCDQAKAAKKTMIALENVPHWKTGNEKVIVRSFQ